MSKYIDAGRLKELLDAKYKEFTEKAKKDCPLQYQYMADGLDIAEQFIDSLQQGQPDVDFKIEERKWVHDAVDNIFPEDGDFMSEVDFRKILKDTAHHFYELGLKAKEDER